MEKYISRYQFSRYQQLRNQFLHVIYSLMHTKLYLNYLKSVRKRRGSYIYTSDNQLSEEYAHQNKDLLLSIKKGKERTI